jgi:hypothetical protein
MINMLVYRKSSFSEIIVAIDATERLVKLVHFYLNGHFSSRKFDFSILCRFLPGTFGSTQDENNIRWVNPFDTLRTMRVCSLRVNILHLVDLQQICEAQFSESD